MDETQYLMKGENGKRLQESIRNPEYTEYKTMEELRREFVKKKTVAKWGLLIENSETIKNLDIKINKLIN